MERYTQFERGETLEGRRLVVKLGSSVVAQEEGSDGPLNRVLMRNVSRQCGVLYKDGAGLAVVSSGAVASGRRILNLRENGIIDQQVEAIYGQPILNAGWVEDLGLENIVGGQVLLGERDLEGAKLPLRRAIEYGIPAINANDPANEWEMRQLLKSADNDWLSGFVVEEIDADTLIILTNVAGVLDSAGFLIEDGWQIDLSTLDGKSEEGTGGILSKVMVARKVARRGVDVFIASAWEKDIILRIVRGEYKGICTRFEAKEKEFQMAFASL